MSDSKLSELINLLKDRSEVTHINAVTFGPILENEELLNSILIKEANFIIDNESSKMLEDLSIKLSNTLKDNENYKKSDEEWGLLTTWSFKDRDNKTTTEINAYIADIKLFNGNKFYNHCTTFGCLKEIVTSLNEYNGKAKKFEWTTINDFNVSDMSNFTERVFNRLSLTLTDEKDFEANYDIENNSDLMPGHAIAVLNKDNILRNNQRSLDKVNNKLRVKVVAVREE
jgi:hypothetical protein